MTLLRVLAVAGAAAALVAPQRRIARGKSALRGSPADWPGALSEACDVEEAYDARPLSVGSAAALVAGTTVGAGVLALPAATAGAGFAYSSGVLVGSWAFMALAALLVAETSVAVVCSTGRADLGFLATVNALLGPRVGGVAGGAYAFIHYALLVAYAANGGALAATAVGADPAVGALAFTGVFGGAVAFGSEAFVDALNNAFVVAVLGSFCGLLFYGSDAFESARLFSVEPSGAEAFKALPISILALVYHNVVPLIATRLKGDRTKITQAVLLGSAVPLAMFIAWNGLVLGAAGPVQGDPVAALVNADPDEARELGIAVGLFAFSAVVTSFVGFYFGLRVYVKDVLVPLAPKLADSEPLLAAIVLGPPAALAAFDPTVFLGALDAAGTFGITTLFGIVPAACAYALRREDPGRERYVPGGDATLAVMAALSLAVVVEGGADLLAGGAG